MSVPLIAALLALGGGAGFLAGLLGIGGGVVMVPFMTMILTASGVPLEHVVHIAIATSLATILFTSASSVRAFQRLGSVRWPIVLRLAPGILVGGLVGAHVAGRLPTPAIALVFALFVGVSATLMLLDRKPSPHRELPGSAGLAAVGSGIGLISSLVGAGGGFMSVPFMVWCNVKIHDAIGTSAAIGFPIAAAGTVGYVWAGLHEPSLPAGTVGYIHLPALFTVVAASMLAAPVGTRTAQGMDVRRLRRAFAILLYLLAAYMLWKAGATLGLWRA